jgi:hypothetical protein
MAIVLKPRSNKQGVVELASDLALLNGRPDYQVLVKDLGLFEWVVSGVVDNDNIYPALNGYWSKVLESNESVNLDYTPEDIDNKSSSIAVDGTSDVKYPTTKAVKIYADSLILGLLNDRGSFTPGGTSPGAWPTTGGSGVGGAIKKGDIWFCSASGFMGTTAVVAGASFRALVDSPGQTATNWNVLSAGAISITNPTLQQVTTAGATTAVQSVSIINNLSTSTFTASSTGGNGGAEIGYSSSLKGFLNVSNGSNTATVRANDLTADRTYQLPNSSGTLALTSQVGSSYNVWAANLTQSGTNAPTATILQNTLGGTVVITRESTGFYKLTLSQAFPSGKTAIFTKGVSNTPSIPKDVIVTRFGSSEVVVLTGGAGVYEDDVLNAYSVEIRVYP